jgi:hypothetical protein
MLLHFGFRKLLSIAQHSDWNMLFGNKGTWSIVLRDYLMLPTAIPVCVMLQ